MHTDTKATEHQHAETFMFSIIGILTGILAINLTTSIPGWLFGYAVLVTSAATAAWTLHLWIPLMKRAYRQDHS